MSKRTRRDAARREIDVVKAQAHISHQFLPLFPFLLTNNDDCYLFGMASLESVRFRILMNSSAFPPASMTPRSNEQSVPTTFLHHAATTNIKVVK